MKKTIKVFAAIMLVAAMVLSIASCGGIDMNKVKGDWIVSTVNGKSVADFAAELGTVEAAAMKVWSITDKQGTLSCIGPDSNVISSTGDLAVRSNGVEITADGILYPLKYVDADGTLTYTVDQYTYVLVKGTYDLKAKFDEQKAAVDAFNAENEGGETGGEEDYSEEDYGEEDYSEEE